MLRGRFLSFLYGAEAALGGEHTWSAARRWVSCQVSLTLFSMFIGEETSVYVLGDQTDLPGSNL